MAIGTAAVTFDIADQLGNDFDPRRTKIWITTNIPGDTIIDKAGNKIRLGSGNVTLNADGTGSMLVWVPGADANPSSWQTTVHVDYPDRNKTKGRATKSFGPFTITANADLADLVAEMPVQPEYLTTVLATVQDMIDDATSSTGPALAAISQRVNGYTDHGNVSGAVTFNGPTASHRFDATGPTTVTLAGFGEGGVATLICFSGAENVTVVDAGDAELVDGTAWSAERARGIWVSGGGGGTPATPDATPPTSVTGLTATGGENQIAASWTAATDSESTVRYRWRAWLTSGGATGTWAETTSTNFTKTGLAAGAYTVQVYSYSNGGQTSPVTATATVTAGLTTDFLDTFTRSEGVLNSNPTPDTGAAWEGNLYSSNITADGMLLTTAGGVSSPRSVPARQLTASVVKPTTGERWIGVQSSVIGGIPDGMAVQFNGAGRLYVAGLTATFNVTGGTNPWTTNGYVSSSPHVLKVTHEGAATAIYLDDVKVLEGTTVAPSSYRIGVGGDGDGKFDNIEVKH